MAYHIKLGDADDLREYSLAGNGIATHQESANPFSARLNTSEQYGDLEGWNEWVDDDWTEGIGYRDPEEGMLYAQSDTRFPNQAMLPMGMTFPDVDLSISSGTNYATGDLTLSDAGYSRVSTSFTTGASGGNFDAVWLYVDAPDDIALTVELQDDSSNLPGGTVHATGSLITSKYRPGPYWLRVPMDDTYTMSASTRYHIEVTADTGEGDIDFPKVTLIGEFAYLYDSSYESQSGGFQFLISFANVEFTLVLEVDSAGDNVVLEADDAGDNVIIDLREENRIRFYAEANGFLYSAHGFDVRYWNVNTKTWVTVDTVANVVQSLITTGTDIFYSYGTGISKITPGTNPATVTDYTDDADLLVLFKGLLYKSDDNNLYYSSDGTDSSWTGPIAVGPSSYSIRGMAGMGDNLYISTDDALYLLAPGDYVVGLVPWPTTSSNNGQNMLSWMSDLYIPLEEDLIQYNEGGGLVQVGLKRAEGLPNDVQGRISYLYSTQYFLLAAVRPPRGSAWGSVWAYNGQGWHSVCQMPQDVYGGPIHLDINDDKLWIGSDYGLSARLEYPSAVLNPAKQAFGTKLFARTGWIEWDWFYGGPIELQKDMESVYLFSDVASSTAYYTIYWQDDGSSDWELLGTVTGTSQEVRWTLASGNRPATRRIKLGVLMRTDDDEITPLLRAIRLKFHTNVTDRWKWQASIEVHDNQQMLGPGVQSYTLAQMNAHLTSMVQSVPPVIFEWLDGNQYEVKITNALVRPTRLEMKGSTKVTHYQWDLTLEQVTQGVYA